MPILKSVYLSKVAAAAAAVADKEVPVFTGVFVERAKSGRANCPVCNTKNEAGEHRVGVDSLAGGRFVTVWIHPKCWLTQAIAFSRNTSGRGACKVTKKPFQKEDLRFGYRMGGSDSWSHVSLEGIAKILPSVMSAYPSFTIEQIEGFEALTQKEKDQVREALEGAEDEVDELEKAKEQARTAG
eukprot:CAMPEP_0180120666 /NCGR_PEP_ID=MMETSP0986-20121125/2645_1 /TAXON_ID=697907 /ORGANISM="non described non described, Strain CCMP2293" /LENGTH=183 /DNA_ID=CAMNT_0022059765 /DNA_START=63 /DNA_END=611 /DNA_ORIENTATION=+